MKIDLHNHTYFSDGSFSPTDVVKIALKRNVKYLAITDHNVVSGINEALDASEGKNIEIIPGIEIDASVKCSDKDIHIIGLYLDHNNKEIYNFSKSIIERKKEKTIKKLELLNNHFKTNISLEDLIKKTKGVPSTAHIWMVLVDKNLAKDIKEAKEITTKYASTPLDNSNKKISAENAIKMIHNAGGVAALAHLGAYKKENKFITYSEQEELIKELINYGLDGLEIYIPDATSEEIKFGESMAKKYNLKISCGSDFHNEEFIPQNKIGFLDIEKNKISILR